ncbi:MAG: alpha/beta hydrolase, partial [Dehalococcoidia bacterium]|nr:alpha/beta hydrolase [Dehalococcoidia bacterium]
VYDVRGYGQTPFGEVEYNLSVLVDDLRGLIEALRLDRPAVVGYSMGGWVAATLATSYPSLLRALVLTGCSGIMARTSPDVSAKMKRVAELLGQGDIEGIANFMAELCFSPGFKERNPEVFRFYAGIKASNRLENLARIMGGGRGFPSELHFEKIICPTLFIAGEYDTIATLESQRQAQMSTPNSKLVVLPAGHASMLELPEEFNNAVMQFLKSLQ